MSVDGTLERVLAKVPELSDAADVAELPGGLTNTNYKITTASGAYVVRVSAKDAGLLAIDRENEYLNTVAAADAGVGAPVTAYLPEENVLVLEFIVGQTQSPEDLAAATSSTRSPPPAGGFTAPGASATTSTCSGSRRAI